MIAIQGIDLTLMNTRMNRYVTELGMKASDVTKQQAGLLLRDIVNHSGPVNLAKSQKQAVEFSKNVFNQVRPAQFAFKRPQQGTGEMRWLAAGPQFLLGTDAANFQPEMSVEQAANIYFEKTKANKFGPSYVRAGRRGKQHVMKLNRIVIRRGTLRSLQKIITEGFGKLKASFAVGWDELGVKGRLPAWVKRHIQKSKSNGRGQVIVNLKSTRPSVTIISRANGCTGEKSLAVIKGAVRYRSAAMLKDLALYAKGIKKHAGFKLSN